MTDQITPEQAAQMAEGREIPDGTRAHMESEGIETEPDPAFKTTFYQSLWSTSPNPPLEAVESPWNPSEGGLSRVYRGVMKMADVDGLPAAVDILVGLAEFHVSHRDRVADSQTTEIETMDERLDGQPVDGVPQGDTE